MNTRERLEKAAADMRSFADELDAKDVAPAPEDLQRLVALGSEVKDAQKAHQARADADRTMTDTKSFLSSLSDAGPDVVKTIDDVRLDDGRPANPRGKTFGEIFLDSANYADFKKRYAGLDGIIPSSTKGINSLPFQSGISAKALITGASATSAGAAVRNDLYAPITDLVPLRERTVLDVITMGSTDSDTVEYVQVTSKTNAAAPTAEATTVANGAKPESAMALAVVSTTVKTIAHWMPITKRAASDAGQVKTLVENFLKEGLIEELEDQVIAGDGTGENFTGILTTAGINTVGSAGTDLDAIVDGIRVTRVTGKRRPTALVIHPNDWYSTGFLTAKDANGNYLIGDPRASVDTMQMLWGLQVVVSEGITENTALIGDFRQAILWEREGVTLTMTDSHSDFFVRNILVILAEMRAAFGVLDPQGFTTVTAL